MTAAWDTERPSALDQIDPDLGSIISSLSANSNANRDREADSDADSDFGYKRGTASLGGNGQGTGPRMQSNLFGSASISGGIPTLAAAGSSGRFLEKFSAVAEATREVELLGGGLGSLSIGTTHGRVPSSRRTSFLTEKPLFDTNPSGSIDESVNGSMSVASARQSISEKIDNYLSNNGSPEVYKNRAASISSDHTSVISDAENNVNSTNIWNTQSAASATTFTPMFNQQQMMMGSPQGYPQMYPFGFQPYPFMPMMPQQFSPPMQPEAINSNTESAVPVADGEKDEPASSQQQQQPPHGFNGSPFMYPQPFAPFPFMSPPMNAPMMHHSPSPPPPRQPGSQARRNRSPKSASPQGSAPQQGGRGNFRKPKPQFYRSPMLEEFRNSNTKNYKLRDIFGNAIEFSKDQHGSRFIQQALGMTPDAEKEVFFNELRDVSVELMTDVFGNYVIQKFFEFGSTTQRSVLLSQMEGKIKELSLQMYGCRVVQRAIEFVGLAEQIKIVEELKDCVLMCIKDQNGNHVIQKAIEKIPIDKIEFIVESLRPHIYHLSTHPYGCRVIQRLLEFSDEDDQKFILDELNKFTFFLIQDQYGNYVIQHIIEYGKPEEKKAIVVVVSDAVVDLSKHKFASNVVEKCVMFGNDEQVALILEKVLVNNSKDDDSPVDDRSPLGLMMKDQFANYVVQKLVEVSKGPNKKILIKKIKQYLKQISKPNYGKHLASIEKLILLAETANLSDEE